MALAERLIEKEVIDNNELRQIVEANTPGMAIVPGTANAAPRRDAEPGAVASEPKAAEGG